MRSFKTVMNEAYVLIKERRERTTPTNDCVDSARKFVLKMKGRTERGLESIFWPEIKINSFGTFGNYITHGWAKYRMSGKLVNTVIMHSVYNFIELINSFDVETARSGLGEMEVRTEWKIITKKLKRA